MRPWQRILLALVLVALLWGGAVVGVPVAIDLATRGRRLTETTIGDDLSVEDDPEALAAAAAAVVGRGVELDAYALARMVRSEEPREPPDVKLIVAHTAINDAAAKGWSIFKILTVSSKASRSGLFGNQTSRRYSTKDDPYEQDLGVAELAIEERARGIDRAEGAVKFFNKGAADNFDDVAASWAAEGLRPFSIDPAPSRLVFFRRGAA